MERLQLQYQDEKVKNFIFAMWDLLNSQDDPGKEEFLAELIFDTVKYPAIIASSIFDAIAIKKELDDKIKSGKIFETPSATPAEIPDEIVENQIDQMREERGALEDLAKDSFNDSFNE